MKKMILIMTWMTVQLYGTFMYAQSDSYKKDLEPSVLECKYELVMQFDTVDVSLRKDMMILRMGENVSQFYAYSAFYSDSLTSTPQGKKLWGQLMQQAIRTRNFAQMPTPEITGDYIYKNYPEGKLTTKTYLGTTPCIIEEAYEPQEWTLTDSTKVILDYTCQLAECTFRGRKYQAWFTPEIPISNGPWKFSGLPGLILEVYDVQDHYHYTIKGIQQNDLEPVCLYKFESKKPEKVDRIKFLQLKNNGTGAGINPEIKKQFNVKAKEKGVRKKNARGEVHACDDLEKDYKEE